MKKTHLILAALTVIAATAISNVHADDEIQSVRALYFGNSYTGNTMPNMHPSLGKSAGNEWSTLMLGGPGQPPWTHMMRLQQKDPKFKEFDTTAPKAVTMVILIYGATGLKHIVEGVKWGYKFDTPTDIGDVAACSYLIRAYLEHNPEGRVFIYTAWPGIPEARKMSKEINRGKSKKESRDITHEEMEPFRKAFDYPAAWLAEDYIAEVPDGIQERLGKYLGTLRDKLAEPTPLATETLATLTEFQVATVQTDLAAMGLGAEPVTAQAIFDAVQAYQGKVEKTHSRPHMYAAMDALIAEFPDLWKTGRLGMVPAGDVFLALDKKMKADAFPGMVNVGEFSADGGHVRSGIPRYVLAATHYAVLFKDHPKNIDYKIYDDRLNYEEYKQRFGGYCHIPDLGVHLDITPERARIIDDTIWEVVRNHPYTQVSKE